MKLTILGSGNALPQKKRNAPGYLLEADNKLILLDAGDGAIRQAAKAGYNIFDISHIFITHTHVDHVAGLLNLLWPIRWSGLKKDWLAIYGPPKFKMFYKKMLEAFIPDMNQAPLKINVRDLKNNKFKINNLSVETKLMPEKMEKTFTPYEIGYRLTHKNKKFCFCGDNDKKSQEAIIALAKNCDLLLIENCSMVPATGHLHPELVGEIAEKAKVKKIIATHLPPEADNKKIKKIISKYYKGQIIIARDLMRIKI